MAAITHQELIVGMEVHVELRTRSKMFARVASPAHPEFHNAPPNALIDPVVLALPGALPVMNERAVELSAMVGLALGCTINRRSKWDRKSYFYPDLPKAYQISQYDLPLCEHGSVDVLDDDGEVMQAVRIERAHLEEDAGKLLHEAPGGGAVDGSLVDLNRAGTPLLEIVTAPDVRSADVCERFARSLRRLCRHLGATEGVMQQGHIRFEPNINLKLTLDDGREVRTPIVEVKNLNSFKALRGAVEYEARTQAKRWQEDGRECGPGAKGTRGWDDARGVTIAQREKEDAHDYRYFPDPDLPPVEIDDAWLERVRIGVCEHPDARRVRWMRDRGLNAKDATALVEERATAELYDDAVQAGGGARTLANLLLQSAAKRANERGVEIHELGLSPEKLAAIAQMRDRGDISAASADELVGLVTQSEDDPALIAEARGMIVVRDEGQLAAWCDEVIAQHAGIVEQIRGGKQQAAGRLIGEVMKKSGGAADAKTVRAMLLERIGD
ncbi:MAG: Asp-tRNA(Asn)/Glu-tRNA(Gln) amidotransferase subunit GatB [Planctomycetota bacterium]